MTTIAVTGANGFVGSYAVPALIDVGHRVIAIVRDERRAARVMGRLSTVQRSSVETRQADVTQPPSLPAALGGADGVLHLAAIPRDFDGGRSLRRINTEGTANVLAAADQAGIRRFVHQGALGVVDEPSLHYASSKAKAEALVRASGLDWTIIKPSLLFGPRDGFFNILADLVRFSPGIVPITGAGKARFQPMAIDDVATIVVRVFADPGTIGKTFELGGPAYWTYRELVEEVLSGMQKRRLLLPMPVPLIKLVAGAAELVHLPFPVATDQLRQLRYDNTGQLDSVREAFGFEPRSLSGSLGYLRRRRRDQEPAANP